MSALTPRVEFTGVSKTFRRGELHDSLRDLIPALAARLIGRRRDDALGRTEFWALRDVTFRVDPGQALGIIGPNGAGKSTVLKLLTRILRPTTGQIRVQGRVGSLIELAAGFHPDLTGRENVFLQGAIRGIRRREIARRFDAIVAMAELEPFMDTPVKRYSSGMNARLGFSIAVQLEPDVLVVDEVLSVGDYRFQRKAFEAVRQMIGRGIPVVIVSHQLDRVASLCTDALLLDRGRVKHAGPPAECVARYLRGVDADGPLDDEAPIALESLSLTPAGPVRSGHWLTARVAGAVRPGAAGHLTVGVIVRSLQDGRTVFGTELRALGQGLPEHGPFAFDLDLQANVGRGLYGLAFSVWNPIERRTVAAGPEAVFQVADDQGFHGTVNLHARARVTAAADAARVS